METGFLNKHDSEYFSSDATYEQSNGFESEGSFFSSFVNGYNNEFDDYQWGINDEENNLNDTSLNVITNETPAQQDDFNKSFNDWQQHISNLKFREDDIHESTIFLQDDRSPGIFPSCSPSALPTPSLPSLLDDPLNPDLLLDELAAAGVMPDSPLSPPAETKVRIKVEPGTQKTPNLPSGKRIKQEPIDFFSVDLPSDELLDSLTVSDSDSCAPAALNEPSEDLGPDNYDVVDIKVEGEDEEEDEVDIETVTDSMPVIEANDIDSLLDQFEASERVNNMCKTKLKDSKPSRVAPPVQPTPKVPPIIIKKTNSLLKVEQAPLQRHFHSPAPAPVDVAPPPALSPAPSPFSVPKSGPVNKTIIDSLPQEVIDRIKKSSSKKKKIVPVVPAERLPSKGNSHMKDAGASKTKVRESANKKKVKTEAAQMDHDYCTNENGQVTVKSSNDSGKTSVKTESCSVKPLHDSGKTGVKTESCTVKQVQDTSKAVVKMDSCTGNQTLPLPKPPVSVVVDAFSVTEEDKWVLDNEQKLLTSLPTASPSPSEASSIARNNWEKNSKRDSGLESGDVSDASESPSDKKCPPKIQMQTGESLVSIEIKVEKEDCPDAPQADSADYHTEVPNPLPGITLEPELAYEQDKNEPKKKKLNLDEYRCRRKFARLSSPVKTGTIGEAIMSNKWVQRPPKGKVEERKPVTEKSNRVSIPETPKEASPKKYDEDKRRRNSRSRERTRSRYRHRSSSSSSSGSRLRSSRIRGRSRDRVRRTRRSRSRDRNYRSRSSSSSSSSDSRSSSSRSRSGSGSRSRSSRSSRYRGRSRSRSRSCYRRRTTSRRYSPSVSRRVSSDRTPRRSDEWTTGERQKQVEERRVIYVGQIDESTTRPQLRERFQCFGPIVDISLHFRERGDNYGFVTFAYKGDAYKAVEHGNDNPSYPRYDICFGGRRAFCKQRYADLDSAPQPTYSPFHQSRSNESFDTLLRAAREKILRGQKNV
ncbi:hypothetical protein GE061_015158 [Apolygus lucorum]|uniref:RRM domain-containing protein n=1 Tax=Apolygus lucorum TaxID=248454 RepID=A0A8S9XM94_APOLU|nr:hypothetical protein GE061_015158 [Apolygus lucorum]